MFAKGVARSQNNKLATLGELTLFDFALSDSDHLFKIFGMLNQFRHHAKTQGKFRGGPWVVG